MNRCGSDIRFRLACAAGLSLCGALIAAADGASGLEAARDWLEGAAKRTVAGAERRMDSGLAVYNPDVGGSYRATWLRDYAYMLEADAVPHDKVGGASRLFVAAVSTNGWGVDCIKYDGSPVYMPGYGTMGRLAVADGSPFTVAVAYLSWKVTEDSAWLKPDVLGKLERTMAAAPVREGSPLAYISPDEPWERAAYGFTDSVRKKGHCLFESLLLFEAERRLGEMLRAAGQGARAVGHESRARAIAAAVNATFWDDAAGLYRAATVTCREHDVWGSAFAVWLGVADGGRADEVSRALARHYDGLVWKGQVRHNLPGRYWEASNCGRDSYQNGGFWGTPVGWVAWALERTAPELVDGLYRDLVADYRANGVCEWTFGDRRACNKGYPASVCLPLAAVRRILAVRQKFQENHNKETD